MYRLHLGAEDVRAGAASKDTTFEFIEQLLKEENHHNSANHKSNQLESSMNNFLSIQRVTDRCIAHSMVAIIGSCLPSFGIARNLQLVKMFSILPATARIDHLLNSGGVVSARLNTATTDEEIDKYLINYAELEQTLGYRFRDRAYLLSALTHPSFPDNMVTACYQKFAFLGESIIDMLVTAYLMERCVDRHAGELGNIRAALVNNITWACLSVRYRLHVFALTQNAALSEKIGVFAEHQRTQEYRVDDQVQLLIHENDRGMGEFVAVPHFVGELFAAVVAAVFRDSGNDLSTAWDVVYRLMANEIQMFMSSPPLQLIERLEAYPGANPKFSSPIVDDGVVIVSLRFTGKHEILQVQGCGATESEARRAAAKIALCKLEQ